MARPTVEAYEDVVECVRAFNKGLAEGQGLEGQLSYFRAWYYIPELDAVGPSKFVGYKGMTAPEYTQAEDIDGRVTEPVLSRWFDALDSGTPEAEHVRKLVEGLLAPYKKAPNRVARFNAPRGWQLREGATPFSQPIEMGAFDEFWSEVDKYPSMWDSFELKAVVATKDDSSYLLGLHCTLSSSSQPQDKLAELVDSTLRSNITLANRTVRVEGFTRYQRINRPGNGHGWVDISYPYVLLYAHGKAAAELVNESDIRGCSFRTDIERLRL